MPNPSSRPDAITADASLEWLHSPREKGLSRLSFGLGLAGSAALGAGLYARWLAEVSLPYATVLLLVGAAAWGVRLALGARRLPDVRVGEHGVSYGEPGEAPRVPWCEIERVSIAGDRLQLDTARGPIAIPLAAHGSAAARIVRELSLRLPDRVELSPNAHARLPKLGPDEGERVPAPPLQATGRRCAASGQALTFEADALWCPNCSALYHRSHAPPQCAVCQRPLKAE